MLHYVQHDNTVVYNNIDNQYHILMSNSLLLIVGFKKNEDPS